MTLMIALYLGLTAFTLAAFPGHRHSAATAASLHLSR